MHEKAIVVLYHAECPDGFAAAWVAWKKFGDMAEYLPMFHNNTSIVGSLSGRQVYMLDITYEMPVMKELIARNEVAVLDHHLMRKKEVEAAQKHLFSDNQSGAGLAWEYFFPEQPMPYLLGLIQEEDLWKFKTENIKEILAAINSLPFPYGDFVKFGQIVAEVEDVATRAKYIEEGTVVLRYKETLIADMLRRANPVTFEGHDVMCVNSSVYVSEIGNRLAAANNPPFGIIWSVRHGKIAVSLRSDGTFDIAKLAEKYGGGGHKAAAAFTLPLDSLLPWKYRNED